MKKEIEKQSETELQTKLRDFQEQLQQLRFQAANSQLKNVHEIQVVRKNIARILNEVRRRAATKNVIEPTKS
ncbi:MAG TPA: 50S ribosomal protein L29 [Patescibacteria group bacterium]|nr:50S ribosomal protein L29 [Patescibacteria group bacterium]